MTGVLNATSISIRERELGNSNSIEPERSLDNISRGEESSLKSYRDAKLDEKSLDENPKFRVSDIFADNDGWMNKLKVEILIIEMFIGL